MGTRQYWAWSRRTAHCLQFSARKVKPWPGPLVTADLAWDRWAREEALRARSHVSPLALSSPWSIGEPRCVAALLQPLLSRPRAETPSLPGASHGERRRRGRRKDRRGGRSRGGLF